MDGSSPRIRRDGARRFDAVLFDLYGTLISSGDRTRRRGHFQAMARELGVDPGGFTEGFFDTFDLRVRGQHGSLEDSIRKVANSLGGSPTEAQVLRAVEIRMEYSAQLLGTCTASLPALDALRSAGLRLAVVSDCSDETPRQWANFPLATRFEAAIFSCRVGLRKPDPRIYTLALEALGLPASRCAFVGDGGSHELTGAREVGLGAFLYRFPEDTAVEAFRVDGDTQWSGPQLTDLSELLSPG